MKKFLLFGVIVATALTYLATTPYRAQQALARALQEGDEAALVALVDADAIRSDLRLQLDATLSAGASTGFLASERNRDDASAALRAQAVVDHLAEPAALRALIVPAAPGERALKDPLAGSLRQLAGTREFRITLAGAADPRAASELVLVRHGLRWRLARVTVAPEALLAEDERLREEADARRRQALQDEIDALQAEAEQAARQALRSEWQRRARALVRQQRERQVHHTASN